ncbi:site-specific DNA-methyltransferase [Rhizobium leguminosarum]|uniref:site-specific DNA-methyltransferase n=1 Tax=Rhizobium leguminosarum TaxID=384 RepID=UPI001441BA18|nr:site-specific DNA-methyltransferase [Rhizobium leguminosarum]NKL58320.1 site-specific DNA-methyltransferase [Rhizobium leguminosarum bv. viciae]
MTGKNKLELTWIGKDKRPRLEPRILLENPTFSYHAPTRKDGDIFDNILIKGDNLLALKALEQQYLGRVKCVYIDPPYNTGSAFEHYDDGVEHSIWLGLMRDRIEILHSLLSDDGSLWISIDDNECHYLKVMCDEIFGRENFVSSITWQMIYTTKNSARHFSAMHDYVLVYAKNKNSFSVNLLNREDKQNEAYRNLDEDPRGPWKATPLHARNFYAAGQYEIVSPSGRKIKPPSGTFWRISEQNFKQMNNENRIWWGRDGTAIPSQKRFLSDVKQGVVPSTLWLHSDAGHNGEAKNEIRALLDDEGETFLTPKPERLIRRILDIATNPNDLVLDSFAGSGTTGAVAHKMGRRWIMVELGDHCETHVVPRLRKVIDGEDQGGISKGVEWRGGGGYRYYKLAPSLLEKDNFGQWVFSKSYNAEMLTEALCKHFGFSYAPSSELYWQHGHASESDFIFVTTTAQSLEQLKTLSGAVGPDRSLLICCTAFEPVHAQQFPNLTLRKIPNAILDRCEWGHDDYSLKIANLPIAEEKEWEFEDDPAPATSRRKPKAEEGEPDLFGEV